MEGYTPLREFYFWCQKVLPLVYDNSLSYYEVLCKLTDYLNTVINNQAIHHESILNNQANIQALQADVKIIQENLTKFINGDYTNLYINSLANWIDNNLQSLVGRIVKYVFFGLTDDGYFVAYIPPNWNFITFDTIINPVEPLYGHLLLQW